ncbi:MAG TPA: MerR family transcriptional regulator [Janthinobacterium sp.]|nr:MerR family transcriptional regulator [Janthinobacterium sp.]
MLLKIGELGKSAGLTVRALHHYDAIGLLRPSVRSDAGHRLYNRADIDRLHRILALRKFGLALADIGAFLAQPGLPLADLVAEQLHMLTRQIDQASALRARLTRLHEQLAQGREPESSDWLGTLELMGTYDKYFTPDELRQLPMYVAMAAAGAEWRALVAAAEALLRDGVAPQDAQAQALAARWMATLERDTAANPALLAKLSVMRAQEPLVQERTGITDALTDYIRAAFREGKLAIYRRYLTDEEFAHLRANYGRRGAEWPPLIAQVRVAMERADPPWTPEVQALARQWFELFRDYAGERPETHLKLRAAHRQEPGLTAGTWIDAAMRDYMGAAMASLGHA